MMTWTLTFVIVAVMQGQPVRQETSVQNLTGIEHCARLVRDYQARLRHGARIVQPRCEQVGYRT
jgi:hypothetical protein